MPRGKPNQRYTPEFKKLVIETMRTEHLGYLETAARFNIRHKRIQDWEPIYLEEGSDAFDVERRGHGCKNKVKKLTAEAEENLLAEVQRLRAENEYLKNLQALVLEEE